MARPRATPDLYLLSKAGTLYYMRGLTQKQIADRLGVSRPTVSRLLEEARTQGIVTISVVAPPELHLDLEAKLEERFGLEEALVVTAPPRRPADVVRQIGIAAAGYLSRSIHAGDTIGLAWGHTLNAMVQSTPVASGDDLRIVQILGGIGPPAGAAYAADMVRRLARQLGASPVLLPAPGVVSTPAARHALRRDPHVQAAVRLFDKLDKVFVGIGSLASNEVLNDGHSLPRGTNRRLANAGAIGDIALRFFDENGDAVRSSLDDRVLGISLDQLEKAKRVIAVAGGSEKIDAIHAALKSGIVDVLITDNGTAQALVSR